jgi:hypothetical protein
MRVKRFEIYLYISQSYFYINPMISMKRLKTEDFIFSFLFYMSPFFLFLTCLERQTAIFFVNFLSLFSTKYLNKVI